MEIMFIVTRVIYLDGVKRHVAHHHIEKMVGESRLFKTHHLNVRIGVKLPCDLSGDGVDFTAVELGGLHAVRQHGKEVARTKGGV
ncbi:hypothetical protein SDC9_71623 [bioreactor metagenome]|uniref:Uncharacterized protein n=1 Tax=bioreactor metagenome TaxID=1076179 RepID=A0A644YF22_9ZZZZ